MTEFVDFDMPVSVCPECGYKLERATETLRDGRRPGPGDFSVCMMCAAVLRFDEQLKLVATTIAERSEAGPELEHVVRGVLLLNMRGRKKKRGKR